MFLQVGADPPCTPKATAAILKVSPRMTLPHPQALIPRLRPKPQAHPNLANPLFWRLTPRLRTQGWPATKSGPSCTSWRRVRAPAASASESPPGEALLAAHEMAKIGQFGAKMGMPKVVLAWDRGV